MLLFSYCFDSLLSNLLYYVSIILNIRNCKSQDRLGYITNDDKNSVGKNANV